MRKKKSRGKKALRKSQPVGTQVNEQRQRMVTKIEIALLNFAKIE